MARFELRIKPGAAKELGRLGTKSDRMRIVSAVRRLADEPRPVGSEKLAGADDLHRIRIGNYRVLYSVDDSAVVVTLIKVGHRKDVYR